MDSSHDVRLFVDVLFLLFDEAIIAYVLAFFVFYFRSGEHDLPNDAVFIVSQACPLWLCPIPRYGTFSSASESWFPLFSLAVAFG